MSDSLKDVVQRRAQSALDSSPIYDLHDLHVEHSGGGLVITGSVSSFYHKQLVQELVRAVVDGIEVVNSVDVR
jgi:hypothetical protein